MSFTGSCLVASVLCLLSATSVGAIEPSELERARQHYESGISLFEAGNKEQALVEFQFANFIAPRNENLFMIAQCEYHLGHLVDARTHYQAYLESDPQGDLAELAKIRVEAINRRPGILVITTIPDPVNVRIEGEGKVFTGQAPGEFRVPHGHYQVTVTKPDHASIIRKISIEVAETRPLFFKLEPIPAHLEIHTIPENAGLYVQGNRTKNPYAQDVPPGSYDIYAEATYYQPRREVFRLKPGERRVIQFPLTYVQRSGRPELIGFWAGMGAVGGGMLVLTRGNTDNLASSLSLPLFAAGMLAGGIGAGVIATATAPAYIRDNLAMFRIGATWVGDLEGLTLGMALTQSWKWGWLAGSAGMAGGALSGWWLERYAPNYGRVALMQSAAIIGALAGMVAVPAMGLSPSDPTLLPVPSRDSPDYEGVVNQNTLRDNAYRNEIKQRLSWGMFAGLNLGVAAGLSMAYLPDQSKYGPSWQRVALIDLAAVSGAFFAGVTELCTRKETQFCADTSSKLTINGRTARYGLVGAGIGLVAGYMLTKNYDKEIRTIGPEGRLSFMPMPTVLPVESGTGAPILVPGLAAQGRF